MVKVNLQKMKSSHRVPTDWMINKSSSQASFTYQDNNTISESLQSNAYSIVIGTLVGLCVSFTSFILIVTTTLS